MNKTAIKNFAVWARRKLIADITYKAGLIGVSENGIAEPLPQSTRDLQFFDIGTKDYAQVAGKDIDQRNALVKAIREKEQGSDYATAFKAIIEEIAYTWFNRLIAIRFMEVNDYLPSRIRVLSSENPAKNEPDFVTAPFDTDMEFTDVETDRIMQLKDENKLDELFRMLFIKQCNKLHEILPQLFEKTNDYTELLLTISFTDQEGVVWHLVHDIEAENFDIEKEGQVEIIGWMYQYYNIEPKDETFALLKKNVKITKERIPAATQLFTPDWIVRYMVENSLGRLWVEGHPNENLKENWKYYLEEAKQEPDVQAQLEEIRAEYRDLNPEDIKVIDPCMGSGHILVYCFDVLMQIYESQGYTQRDAAQSILENNLFGLDIDNRAAQLAYFAVMMKARQYDRRIFNREIKPYVYAIQESNGINRCHLDYFGADLSILEKNNAKNQMNGLLDTFVDAKEYGSILNVDNYDWELLHRFVKDLDDGQLSFDTVGIDLTQEHLITLIEIGQVMAQKYHTVVTNPPYMGDMNKTLLDYVKSNYPNSKHDLCSVFIEKCLNFSKPYYYVSMITQNAFMFLSRYEKLRRSVLQKSFVTMAHLGARAFDEINGEVVQTTTFVIRNNYCDNYKGTYSKLTNQPSERLKEKYYLQHKEDYVCQNEMFYKIPKAPMTYWVSEKVLSMFNLNRLDEYADPRVGMFTTDNDKYLREWWETNFTEIGFNFSSKEEAYATDYKWFPYNKGGGFRRWYGNIDLIVKWFHGGEEIKEVVLKKYPYLKGNFDFVLKTDNPYYNPGITWSGLTTGANSFRMCGNGFLFDTNKGAMIFKKTLELDYLLGFLNTKVAQTAINLLNSTISLQIGDVAAIPVNDDNEHKDLVIKLSNECVNICKQDWNDYDTSWDFKTHPLISVIPKNRMLFDDICNIDLSECYMCWENECNERFNQLKANEEELNRIFIDIYGLQDELTPEVEDKDVTVRKADFGREIRSLLSYAVGCMFGRYSLDVEGLAYAGGEWDDSKYSSFIPDADNCIPITDEEYFEDDIVGRFCDWMKKVFGEKSLESNLEFIAKALGNKGTTSREVIRNYFLNDFIKDHIKIYQKRPIYWLFDSGKQNGFKALVYMHRWNADTVGNLRVEYLHKTQHIYEREIQRMQEIMDNSHDSKEVAKANKRKDKLQKQLKETQEYDAKLAHIALSRIDIDLDDGVKVNYEKVQTGKDGKKMQILAKI